MAEPIEITASPMLSVDSYLAIRGRGRLDLSAGFRRWVKPKKIRRKPLPEWDTLWEQFQTRNAKGNYE